MKTPSLIDTDVTPANDFDAAVFVGPRQPPHLKLVEKTEAPALPPRRTAAEQMAIQQAMQKAALAANPPVSRLSTPPIQQQQAPIFIQWQVQQQQQQTGGLVPRLAQQPERPYPWTPMKPQ